MRESPPAAGTGSAARRAAAAGALLAAFALGLAVGRRGAGPRRPSPASARAHDVSSLIHPLLDCAPQEGSFRDILPVKEDIERVVKSATADGRVSHISVYYRDLDLGPWYGHMPEARFAPASLLKVPLMMAYLRLAEDDRALLSRRVRHEARDIGYPQHFKSKETLVPGRDYTIEQYLEAMIVHSDNQAAYFLLSHLEPGRLEHAYKGLGLKAPDRETPSDWITVHEYASFFRVLYNCTYLSREMSVKALELLSRSSFDGGLQAGAPPGTRVAHKFGERLQPGTDEKQLHDCGVVYHPKNPYLLCVMSRGKDIPAMLEAIRRLSKEVWDDVSEQAAEGRP